MDIYVIYVNMDRVDVGGWVDGYLEGWLDG